MDSKTLRVTWKGRISLIPDVIVVTISVTAIRKTYEEAINSSSEDVNTLKDILSGYGVDKNTVKTSYFDVSTAYRRVKKANEEYVSELIGYKYKQLNLNLIKITRC